MSNRWGHELQQCLDTDIDFPVAEFIKLHTEVPQPAIRRRHAQLCVMMMKRLPKRAALGIQAATVASLNTPESQAAKGSSGGKKNTTESQADKGTKNTAESQAAKGFVDARRTPRSPKRPRVRLEARKTPRSPKPTRAQRTPRSPKRPRVLWTQEEHRGVPSGQEFV